MEFPCRCAFDRLGLHNLSLISNGARGWTQKPVASCCLCLPFYVYYTHTRDYILYKHTHTHTNTLPGKGKTNLVRTRAIGLSPLKGDFLADPLRASLSKQDGKFPGKTASPFKEAERCQPGGGGINGRGNVLRGHALKSLLAILHQTPEHSSSPPRAPL